VIANLVASIVGAIPVSLTDYESIATFTNSSSQATITFSSIPSTYTHLQLRVISRSDRAASQDGLRIQINGDSNSSNYVNYHVLYGDGSSAAAAAVTSGVTPYNSIGTMSAASATSGMFGATVVDILDYKNTNKYKTTRALYGTDQNGSGQVGLVSSLWMSTSAINQIVISQNNGNTVQYSSFALYGIK
jgi:hypothetical protein